MPGEIDDWMDVDRHLAIHERCLDYAGTYFIEEPDSLVVDFLFTHTLRIHGDLVCKGGLTLHVDKYLEHDSKNQVRGYRYRYHAQFVDPPLRQIFRYDNDHVYVREGHADAFHKHIFSDRTWKEIEVQHVGRENFPTLLEVIDELYDWWLRKRNDPLIYH